MIIIKHEAAILIRLLSVLHKTHIGTQRQQAAIEIVMVKNLLGDMVRKEALL